MYFKTTEELVHYSGDGYMDPGWSDMVERRAIVDSAGEAEFQTSEVAGRPGFHSVVLDVDKIVEVRESKTPGNHHLIIHRVLEWKKYKKLLKALAKAGVVEEAWVKASLKDGYTTVRLYNA